jgi:isopenicillin-N epimerase
MAFGHAVRREWPLDRDVVYLNHGTVGVTPNSVLAAQEAIRHDIERAPSQFMLREQFRFAGAPTGRPTSVRRAADEVAPFVGARGQDFVFVDNATTGVNAVLRSLPLAPGDEVLLTNHNYGATLRVAQFVARERGASVRVAEVPYPAFHPDALVDSVRKTLSPRTRVAVLDHVTSESALVFPLAELVSLCRKHDVPVLVDAAHAPGMLPIDLGTLGADWYTANLHKWACSPRSCGFLWAAPDRQAELHPPVISWGLDQGFAAEFDWTGTRDVSAWLAAPEGWRFLERLGRDAVWNHNHGLAWQGAQLLSERWGTPLGFRESDIGFMATVAMPSAAGSQTADATRVRDALLFDHHIEVQVHAAHGRVWARISAQVYNEISDIERLADAVLSIVRR